MDKLEWHEMADEFGKKIYDIVKSEEKENGLCRICINNLMAMVGVKNGMHKQMFWWGVHRYLCPTSLGFDDAWSPTGEFEFTLISFERFNVLKAYEDIEKLNKYIMKHTLKG